MDEFNSNFPSNGILPKKETGAHSFLTKYPNYDGKGVVIAIFDTGVDPGAPGLKITPDFKPKIIDLIDATGAGNVDISTSQKVDGDGYLKGLTGRKLKVPSNWVNPSGDYRLGKKALFELCSGPLRERLRRERKEKLWQPNNTEYIAKIQKKLVELKSNLNNKTTAKSEKSDTALVSSTANDDDQAKNSEEFLNTLLREDLDSQLEVLKDLDSKVKDVGPIYDCIVWNDGNKWQACIDTTENGQLDTCKVLTNYRESQEYGTFSFADMLNYSVRILHQDNILEIVTDSGSHGTHVASIASGYYQDKPELNGIAPGAQIISVKIGDNRLNGMETNFALVNACRYVIEYKCDLVNYSFGEPINFSNFGPAVKSVEEMIEKYGVIFCGSAGNDGPGIETTGAPGGFANSAISVAAYVSSDMIKAEHSLLGNGSSMLFTWSSRGPALDGHSSVTCCAPGGAFASVPNWTQRGTQLMSGTSMSSPNCCGCLALILSALKANRVDYNPFAVKRAIENTAIKVDEPIGTGAGMIQVEKAYEYLVENKENIVQKMTFRSKCGRNQTRGIYLKSPDEIDETRDYQITIEPFFFEKSDYSICDESANNNERLLNLQRDKISFSKKIALVCETNDAISQCIEYPSYLYMVNGVRQFFIRIRASQLQEGQVHFTHIKGFDIDDPKVGCLFQIPITIVKPHIFNSKNNKDYELSFQNCIFKQGKINRHFILPPLGATHAELTLTCDSSSGDRDNIPLFNVQAFTLGSYRSKHNSVREEAFRLNLTNEFKFKFKLNPNKIAQLAIAKSWSSIGQANVSYRIKLFGLTTNNSNEITMLSGQPTLIQVGSYLRNEKWEPSITWKYHIQPLKPSENQIELVKPSMGSIRPIYQIILTYNFHQVKTDEVCCEVPLISNHLYENEYQSMFWMIFDANTKQLILAGDSFPSHYKYKTSIEKGDYIIRLHIRHYEVESLEKLRDITLNVRHTLSGQLGQEFYANYGDLLRGSKRKSGPETIQKNTETSLYIGPIQEDKLPKGIANGHFLTGNLRLFPDSSIQKVDKHQLIYQVNTLSNQSNSSKKGEKSSSKANSSSSASSKIKNETEKLKEAVRDIEISYLTKVDELFEKLSYEYSDFIPVYLNRIQYLEQQFSSQKEENKAKARSLSEEIIRLSKLAIEKINVNELLKYLGEKIHDASMSQESKKEFDNQKNWIIELLVSQGVALIESHLLDASANDQTSKQDLSLDEIKGTELFNELKSIFTLMQKFIDINDIKVSRFTLKFYSLIRLNGKALKVLLKQTEEKSNPQQTDKYLLSAFNKMELKHAEKFLTNLMISKYQTHFAIY